MAIRHSFGITAALVVLMAPACSADHAAADAATTKGTATAKATSGSDAMSGAVLTSGNRAIELGAAPTRVTLISPSGDESGTLAKRVESGRRLFVVIRGLRAEEQPGVLYHAYLDLPADAEPEPDDPRHIGSINFFAFAPPAPADPERVAYSFDITEAARALRARGLLAERTTITIRPGGEPGAKSAIARIDVIEQ